MTVDALIFDFDGLIMDTEGPEWETWRSLYQEHNAELDLALWQRSIGLINAFDPLAHLEQLVATPIDREQLLAAYRERLERACLAQPVLPGVLELLDAAGQAGLKAAVASSSSRSWVERWLTHHDLIDRFACVRTRDDVAQPKPAPDLYLSAAACLDVAPERCVAIEDSLHGLQAALAAGMRCIVVPTALTASLVFTGATLRLQSLADVSLAEIIDQIASSAPR